MKQVFIQLIKKTENPIAPLAFNDAFNGCDRVARILVPFGSNTKVEEITSKLLQSFPDNDDAFARDPNFIISLCSLLSQSLVEYARAE